MTTPALAIVVPTHNRPDELNETVRLLASLDAEPFNALGHVELVVADNASETPVDLPGLLPNGISVRAIRLDANRAAAARNTAAESTEAPWVLMLDDDTAPLSLAPIATAIEHATPDVGAITATITLPGHSAESPRYEAGGLPAVPVGCGVLYRTSDFLDTGGYDPAFHFYVEEYDLAAKLILAGKSIAHDPAVRVVHRKTQTNRDFGAIVRRLTRNNAWVIQRYAPEHARDALLEHTLDRYGRIARTENASDGHARALEELAATLGSQPCTPMTDPQFDVFTGRAHARSHLARVHRATPIEAAALLHEGKNASDIRAALWELGIPLTDQTDPSATLIPATLSPGPILNTAHAIAASNPGVRVEPAWDPRTPVAPAPASVQGEPARAAA